MPTTIPPEGPVDNDPLNKTERPEAPAKPHRAIHPLLIGAISVAAVVAFGLIALNVFRGSPEVEGVPAPHGTWVPSPVETWAPGHYEGPTVSFDYPKDWHEFYLTAGWQYFAAYGPVSGGDVDYVAVFPAPAETKKIATLEDFVKWNGVTEDVDATGSAKTVDVNGLTGYKMPIARTGPSGQDLVAWSILVKGERGDYLIACQYEYSTPAEAQVSAGCETLMHTLVEVPPPSITDPADCTDTELALLSSVPLPEGSDPKEPRGATEATDQGRHYCDLMVFLPRGYDGNVVDYFRPRMTQAGWDSEPAKIDRTFEVYEVWRIFAIRDWDSYMVEAYVEGGHTDHFFITVMDG